MLPSPIVRRGNAQITSPLQLFANGEQGAWWDLSDAATLFQSGTRSSPGAAVTADGQSIGLVLDKSPNHYDLVQATAINKPKWKSVSGKKYSLHDDSAGDWMVFPATFPVFGNTWSRVSGFNLQGGSADMANGHIYSDAGGGSTDISIYQDTLGTAMRTGAATGPRVSLGANTDAVLTELWASPAPCQLALDNNAYVNTPSIAGVGPRGQWVGMSNTGTDHMKMQWYGAVLINRALTPAEVAFLRTYWAAKQGRVL